MCWTKIKAWFQFLGEPKPTSPAGSWNWQKAARRATYTNMPPGGPLEDTRYNWLIQARIEELTFWDGLPPGPWTDTIASWTLEDKTLANLTVQLYRNLARRLPDTKDLATLATELAWGLADSVDTLIGDPTEDHLESVFGTALHVATNTELAELVNAWFV